jgi:hypothetical protein
VLPDWLPLSAECASIPQQSWKTLLIDHMTLVFVCLLRSLAFINSNWNVGVELNLNFLFLEEIVKNFIFAENQN